MNLIAGRLGSVLDQRKETDTQRDESVDIISLVDTSENIFVGRITNNNHLMSPYASLIRFLTSETLKPPSSDQIYIMASTKNLIRPSGKQRSSAIPVYGFRS